MEARGVRLAWSALPMAVHDRVADILGSPVVAAESQPGGFSPGCADRVVTAAGTRAFVKAVSAAQNPDTPALHRREIEVTAELPPGAPVPRLLGSFDDGTWVCLVLEDVAGRQPRTPWVAAELDAVLTAVETLGDLLTPSPLPAAPAADRLADELRSWDDVRADPPADLDPWAADHLDLLADLGRAGLAALTGATLVHTDLRADNVLLREDGTVAFVDWPWACVGPRWLDPLLLLVDVAQHGGGHDVDALVRRQCPDAVPSALTGVLAGLAGYFVDRARRPPPPRLPTVRAFQAAQGRSTLAWVRQRVGAC